jgi:hypothetical protein
VRSEKEQYGTVVGFLVRSGNHSVRGSAKDTRGMAKFDQAKREARPNGFY